METLTLSSPATHPAGAPSYLPLSPRAWDSVSYAPVSRSRGIGAYIMTASLGRVRPGVPHTHIPIEGTKGLRWQREDQTSALLASPQSTQPPP